MPDGAIVNGIPSDNSNPLEKVLESNNLRAQVVDRGVNCNKPGIGVPRGRPTHLNEGSVSGIRPKVSAGGVRSSNIGNYDIVNNNRKGIGGVVKRDASADNEQNRNTWNKSQKLYVGDRAVIRETKREGDVLFVGNIPGINPKPGGQTVGMKLDEKRRTAECDGKHGGTRYFRCPPGYGVFVPIEDVDVLVKGTEKEDAGSLEHCRLVSGCEVPSKDKVCHL